MSQQKRIERIIEAVQARTAEEVGALIGTEFLLKPESNTLLNKKESFTKIQGKQICALMDIAGEVEGQACLLIGIKDAIRLGGTLIMLPENELDEVVGREEYTAETEDSYGEIANIIAGAFTKDFEEMYPKACRFIRKEQSTINPLKMDFADDQPVANQTFFCVSWLMALDGVELGQLIMLMPASPFELEEKSEADVTTAPETASSMPEKDNSQEQTQPPTDEQSAQTAAPVQKHDKFDSEKNRERFDKLLKECQGNLEKEIGGLLATDIMLTDMTNRLVSKEEFFLDHALGEQVITDMEVVGELEGMSYFVVDKKDAIHLGGVLIMLPPSELEVVVAEMDFGEDARDAYGEIANIASGVYTRIFEENYPKKIRFIKKELTEVKSAEVDIESDIPVANQQYYLSTLSLAIEGKDHSKVHMLFPADLFMLDDINDDAADDAPAPEAETTAEPTKVAEAVAEEQAEPAQAIVAEGASVSPEELAKHRARVDSLLAICQQKMVEEISALIGIEVKLENLSNTPVSKEDFFFDRVTSNQVIADMDVVGELEGKSYLSVDLRDAIRMGGVLIMLPGSELESVVSEGNFGEDSRDAYGEITNIIAGVYTQIFEEQYIKQLRFIKTELHQVAPLKVDVESLEPIPNQHYYNSCMDLVIDGSHYGKINFLMPLNLFELQGLVVAAPESVPVEEEKRVVSQEKKEQPVVEQQQAAGAPMLGATSIDVLLIGDDDAESAKISSTLSGLGYSVKTLSFKDNVHNYIPGELRAVYLVMKDVNEQGFGTAIKISSACGLPIVAAGPGWTRSKVIKAVKYGVADILLTPATEADIKENVDNNLMQMAA